MSGNPSLYGILAEFATVDQLLAAASSAKEKGYRSIEAYSPFQVEGLAEVIGFRRNRVPLVAFLGGIAGGVGTYFLQWYSAVVDYPLNIGGRPLHSWPSFIPATFEITILGAAVAAVIGMLVMNGLPQLYHPLFNLPEFDYASRNRFYLCLRADEPVFDERDCREFLMSLQPLLVREVPA